MLQDMKSNPDQIKDCVQKVELVKKVNIQGYMGDNLQNFVKVTVTLPKLIAAAVRLLKDAKVYDKFGYYDYQPFESNVDFDIR